MDKDIKKSIDEIAMNDLTVIQTVENLYKVFKTDELVHAAIAFASAEIASSARNLEPTKPESPIVAHHYLGDMKWLKELEACRRAKRDGKLKTNDNEQDFI